MATNYLKLAAQIEKLQTQANALKAKEKAGVIARIKEAIAVYGLTAEDLGLSGRTTKRGAKADAPAKKRGAKAAKPAAPAKYKNEAGQTWSGRGPRPAWLRAALEGGAKLESFLA